jgi:ketosteroid isomerase-like protein
MMTTDTDPRRDVLDQYFARQNAMDLDGWLKLLTDDVKVLIPFAPADFPHVVDGKQAVADIYRDLFGGYAALQVDVHEVQPAVDPNFATVRWHTHAELIRRRRLRQRSDRHLPLPRRSHLRDHRVLQHHQLPRSDQEQLIGHHIDPFTKLSTHA